MRFVLPAVCAAWICAAALAQEQESPAAPAPASAAGSDGRLAQPANTGAPEGATPPDAAAGRGLGFSVPEARDVPYPGTLTLQVDLSDVERRIFSVHETLPVRPGPLILLYPEWLPGQHAPRGPIDALAGLTITAGGRTLSWQRDAANVYAYTLTVPEGVNQLELDFQFVAAQTHEQGRIVVTPDLLGLQWNSVVLYPAGYYTSRIQVAPRIT